MSTPTTTTPIPNRLPAPNPAPNRPSECPRCGAPAISTKGVGAHDLWHRQQDGRDRRLERVLAALEDMLAAFDGDPSDDPDVGEPKTFRAWVKETDLILDTITGQLDELGGQLAKIERLAPAGDAAEIVLLPWPGDPGPTGEEDETVEPDDTAAPVNPAAEVLAEVGPDGRPTDYPPAAAPDDDDLDEDYIDHPATPQARF